MAFVCPKCNSEAYKRNGYTRHGKQNHRCLDCGKQFSFDIIEPQQVEEFEEEWMDMSVFAFSEEVSDESESSPVSEEVLF